MGSHKVPQSHNRTPVKREPKAAKKGKEEEEEEEKNA